MEMIKELEKKGCRKDVVRLLLFCIHEDIPGSLVNIEMDELKKTLKEMERVGIISKNYSDNKIIINTDVFSSKPKQYTIDTVEREEEKIREYVKLNIHKYRMIFKGTKPGAMGAEKACVEKLTRWMMENPDYTFDDILNTARYYIDSLNGIYKYLRRADYFIFKRDGNKREELSDLSAFIEEGKDFTLSTNEDWTSEVL